MRKNFFLVLFLFAVVFSVNAQNKVGELSNPNGKAKFKWLAGTTHDFGKIKKAEPVAFIYEFVNEGEAPLVITNVHASCGCTATDYSKTPVMPNKKGYVKATYDAATLGSFNKTLTVSSNSTDYELQLVLKGEVIDKK